MLATDTMLQLPNALARRGAKLMIMDGWASRGVNNLPMASSIKGSMQHWIVSNRNGKPRQTLGVVANGHSTLAGPLANIHLDWDGTTTLVAGGRANHGGLGVWKGVSGNHFWIATEAEGPPFTEEQIAAYAIIVCAIADVTGQHPRDWSPSHQEYAPGRKVDIGDYILDIRERACRMYDGFVPPIPVPDPKPEPTPTPAEPVQKSKEDLMLLIQVVKDKDPHRRYCWNASLGRLRHISSQSQLKLLDDVGYFEQDAEGNARLHKFSVGQLRDLMMGSGLDVNEQAVQMKVAGVVEAK